MKAIDPFTCKAASWLCCKALRLLVFESISCERNESQVCFEVFFKAVYNLFNMALTGYVVLVVFWLYKVPGPPDTCWSRSTTCLFLNTCQASAAACTWQCSVQSSPMILVFFSGAGKCQGLIRNTNHTISLLPAVTSAFKNAGLLAAKKTEVIGLYSQRQQASTATLVSLKSN